MLIDFLLVGKLSDDQGWSVIGLHILALVAAKEISSRPI